MTKSSYSASSSQLYKKLNILKLNDIFKFQVAKLMHNYEGNKNKHKPITFDLIHIQGVHKYETRLSTENYFLPRMRTNIGKKSLAYTGPNIWRQVPRDMKILPKKNLNQHTKVIFLISIK